VLDVATPIRQPPAVCTSSVRARVAMVTLSRGDFHPMPQAADHDTENVVVLLSSI